ncbi:MAG: cation:proton antiporter [Planctomycetota bacterium]|nr:cation:proton antiporter [Planctomycetota bacterium]
MTEDMLVQIAALVLIGIGAQWISWRLKMPSILLLLVAGFAAGSVGLLDPHELLGDLFMPFVSVSIAVILFEGGLSLKRTELQEVGWCLRNLISVGVLITWGLTGLAAHFFLDLSYDIALLLAAVLIVSGPTVIMPILRNVRPLRNVASLARWEAIFVDPVGAMFAVLVFEVITGPSLSGGALAADLLLMVFTGTVTGFAAAGLLVLVLKRYLVPDFLINPVALMVLVVFFSAANQFVPESGLFTAMIMGIVLTNQKLVNIKPIVEFKEDLSVMLLSFLFVLLAATSDLESLKSVLVWGMLPFILVLIFVIRPLAVYVSTFASKLSWNERTFLALLMPRGIVAAAVSALFAFKLDKLGFENASALTSLTFFVIVVTVAFYGILAKPLAHLLKVAQKTPDGFLIAGAHRWARHLAAILTRHGYEVLLVDTNETNVREARKMGLRAERENILSEHIDDRIELFGIGNLLAITANSETNALAALRFSDIFDRQHVFQLTPSRRQKGLDEPVGKLLQGRQLFGAGVTSKRIYDKYERGGRMIASSLEEDFDFEKFKKFYGKRSLPLYVLKKDGSVQMFTSDSKLKPKPGDKIVHIYEPIVSYHKAGTKMEDLGSHVNIESDSSEEDETHFCEV